MLFLFLKKKKIHKKLKQFEIGNGNKPSALLLLYTRVIHGWFPIFIASSFLALEVADTLRATLPQLFRESLQRHQPLSSRCHLALSWCWSFLSSEVCLSAWPLGWSSLAISLALSLDAGSQNSP